MPRGERGTELVAVLTASFLRDRCGVARRLRTALHDGRRWQEAKPARWCRSLTQTRSDLLRIEANRVEHALERNPPADVRLHDDPRQTQLFPQLAQPVDDHVRGAVRHSIA